MPYNSEIRVGVQSGNAYAGAVDIQLWEVFTTVDNASRTRVMQVDQERITVNVAAGVATAFSTQDGPSYTDRNNHDIALAAYQPPMPGPIFRSGRLLELPSGSPGNPSALIDTMLLESMRFPMADINAMIPTPITLDDGTTITSAVISSSPPSRVLTLTASGPYGATTFTYTLPFTIDPSDDQANLATVLEATRAGNPTLTFVANPGGGFQAFLDNLFAGLFVGQITTRVLGSITSTLNSSAATAASAAAPGGSLPAGVVLGVRSVQVASNGDLVMSPALGAFGSIIEKFAVAVPPGGSRPICSVIAAGMAMNSVEVTTLRRWRDEVLLPNKAGRVFVALYKKLSPMLCVALGKSALLRAAMRRLVIRPAYRLLTMRN